MGVLGDESCAESGDESDPSSGGRILEGLGCSLLAATDVTFESAPDPMPESRSTLFEASFSLFVLLIVLAFEPLDFVDIFDLSSLSLEVFPDHEFLELERDSISSSSCSFDMRLGVAFLCCENSVSGGLGGLPSLVSFVDLEKLSVDLDFVRPSEPRSVGSGV